MGTPWPGIAAVAGAEWQGLAGVCTLVAKQQDQHILQDTDQHALVELDGQHTCEHGVVLQQLDPEDTGLEGHQTQQPGRCWSQIHNPEILQLLENFPCHLSS